jgi:hypothetical protein
VDIGLRGGEGDVPQPLFIVTITILGCEGDRGPAMKFEHSPSPCYGVGI